MLCVLAVTAFGAVAASYADPMYLPLPVKPISFSRAISRNEPPASGAEPTNFETFDCTSLYGPNCAGDCSSLVVSNSDYFPIKIKIIDASFLQIKLDLYWWQTRCFLQNLCWFGFIQAILC